MVGLMCLNGNEKGSITVAEHKGDKGVSQRAVRDSPCQRWPVAEFVILVGVRLGGMRVFGTEMLPDLIMLTVGLFWLLCCQAVGDRGGNQIVTFFWVRDDGGWPQ
jgi:hypothetical protein